jgi:hypothetical protein
MSGMAGEAVLFHRRVFPEYRGFFLGMTFIAFVID